MKPTLDWQSKEIVGIFDEVNLWSAPFGRLLMENIPMVTGATILDIGFGTGFPLTELSQRFGDDSTIYGIDIWEEAIKLVKNRINVLDLQNIQIIEQSAVEIPLSDNSIDLVTSNLGINNFENKNRVYREIHRVLKQDGTLCITTNPEGTFEELFDLFAIVFQELEMGDGSRILTYYIQHRSTLESLIDEFNEASLIYAQHKSDSTIMRFVDAKAVLNHSLIRVGFREYWKDMIASENEQDFYKILLQKITQIIQTKGEFKMTIPMLYLEFHRG